MSSVDFQNKNILAPLTKGGNLPFRRLCKDFGADITISEMAYARFIVRGEKRERALLRHHESEKPYGVQLAAKDPIEAIEAAKVAVDYGADFIDINCGCPIEDTTRRGLGASLLKRPKLIAKVVESLVAAIPIPVTVKFRLGWTEKELSFMEVARLSEEAGASALFVHGRTREQRYSKTADWTKINEVRESVSIPVIGNGDILTFFEAEDKKAMTGVDSVLLARGALIKPWIFKEIKEKKTWDISLAERIGVYWRLGQYMLEHFRSDERGMKASLNFLTWHFDFFDRYQYLPESLRDEAKIYPFLQRRYADGRAEIAKHTEHPYPPILLASSSAEEAINSLVKAEDPYSKPQYLANAL